MARYPSGKGEVCKTFIREFDSHPRLQSFQRIALDPLHLVRFLRLRSIALGCRKLAGLHGELAQSWPEIF
jgi:hypothetical protein